MHAKSDFFRSNFYGAFKVLGGASQAPLGPRLHKIKAHVKIDELPQHSLEWRRAKGNDAADRMAKQAAGKANQPSVNEIESQAAQDKLLVKYLRYDMLPKLCRSGQQWRQERVPKV